MLGRIKLHCYALLCERYSTPAGHVALEEEGSEAKRLVASGGGYRGGSFFPSDGKPAIFIPPPLSNYAPKLAAGLGIIFLHKLTSGNGTSRLVIVRITDAPWRVYEDKSPDDQDQDAAYLIDAVSLTGLPRWRDSAPPLEQHSDGPAIILSRNLEYRGLLLLIVTISQPIRFSVVTPMRKTVRASRSTI